MWLRMTMRALSPYAVVSLSRILSLSRIVILSLSKDDNAQRSHQL